MTSWPSGWSPRRRRTVVALVYGNAAAAGVLLLAVLVQFAMPWSVTVYLPLLVAWIGGTLAGPGRQRRSTRSQ